MVRKNNKTREELLIENNQLKARISELEETEDTLQESVDQLQKYFDGITDGFAICDIVLNNKGKPIDYRFIRINPAFEKQTGLKVETAIGKTVKELFPDIEQTWIDKYGSVAITGEAIKFSEYNHNTKKHYNVNAFSPSKHRFAMLFEDTTEKRRTETDLQLSEEKYKSLFDSMSEMFQVIELIYDENDKVIDYYYRQVNPTFEKLVGKSKEELLDKRVKNIFGIVEDHWLRTYENVDKTGLPITYENYQEELEKFYHINAWKISNHTIGITFSDITEQKNTETLILESNSKLAAMIENIGDVIAIIDVDGTIKFQSPNIEKWFGWKPEDLIGTNGWEKMHPDDIERIQKEFIKMLDSKTATTLEYRFRCKDDSYKWIELTAVNRESNPTINGVLLNYRDITKRKEAAEILTNTLSLQQATLESAADGILVVDIEGRIIDYNTHFLKIWGMPESLITEGKRKDLVAPENAEYAMKHILGQLTDPQQFILKVQSLYKKPKADSFDVLHFKDGRVIERYSKPQFIKEEPVGRVWNFRDVTAFTKAQIELQESETKYKNLVETASDAIYLISDKGICIDTNQFACNMLGKTKDEIIGLPINSIDSNSALDEFLKFWETIPFNEQRIFETNHHHKDSILIPVEVSAIKYKLNGKVFYYGIARDITDRKKAEEALRESETRFKALHNASFGGIAIHEKGLILDCNQGLSEITGYEINELIGMDGLLLIAEESRDRVMGNILAEYEQPYEAIGLKKNGEEYPIRLVGKMIPYKDKKARVVEFRDITEQKQSEERLLIASSRNEALLDAIPDIIMEVDVNKVYTWANREGIEFFGDDVIGKEASHYFEGEQLIYEIIEPLFKGEKNIVYVESWQRRKDGNKRLLAWHCRMVKDKVGNITGVLSSAMDITDRVLAEKALQESEERFDLAMTAAKDGLYDWNLVTNEIYYSPGWKGMLGYEDDELPNDFSVWEKLVEADGLKKSWDMQQELINKQRNRFELEFKMKHKDGHWVDIYSRAEAIFDENGKAIRIVGTHVDISERKQIEETIKKLNEELEQKVIERTENLEIKNKQLIRMNKLFVGRELRMKELKQMIHDLKEKLEDK